MVFQGKAKKGSSTVFQCGRKFSELKGFPPCVMNKILEILKGELEECRRMLDVAVGTGRFAKPIQDAGFMVVGVDISKKMLWKAYEKGTSSE